MVINCVRRGKLPVCVLILLYLQESKPMDMNDLFEEYLELSEEFRSRVREYAESLIDSHPSVSSGFECNPEQALSSHPIGKQSP